MAAEEGWTRDTLFNHTAELGAMRERHRAAEANIERIGAEMKEGFKDLRDHVDSSAGHLRGEIKSLGDDLERKRQADQRHINEVMDRISDQANTLQRRLIIGLGVVLTVLQGWESWPQIAGLIGLGPQ